MSSKTLPPGKRRHIFFLYRTEDSSRHSIIHLMSKLHDIGYVCGCHEKDFIIGKSYLCNLETCIKSSVVIVPWISKEFLQSPYCMKDLEIACHFYDEGIMVMPLLDNLQFHQIPDILKQLVCLDLRDDESLWTDRFTESLSRHIDPLLSVISPRQEVDNLIQQFDEMSIQAKLLFALKFSAENRFDIPQMMSSLSTKEILDLFEIHVVENWNCFHITQNYTTGVLESECEICVLFSFNSSIISLCDHNCLGLLSRNCATHLRSIVPSNKAYKKVCAVLEYIFNNSVKNSRDNIFHLCYENNYFMEESGLAMLKTNNLRVYDESGKLIRRSCLDLMYVNA